MCRKGLPLTPAGTEGARTTGWSTCADAAPDPGRSISTNVHFAHLPPATQADDIARGLGPRFRAGRLGTRRELAGRVELGSRRSVSVPELSEQIVEGEGECARQEAASEPAVTRVSRNQIGENRTDRFAASGVLHHQLGETRPKEARLPSGGAPEIG